MIKIEIPLECTDEGCDEKPFMDFSRKKAKLQLQCPEHGFIERYPHPRYSEVIRIE